MRANNKFKSKNYNDFIYISSWGFGGWGSEI